ncbi:MAG: FkbM family methyltransferase [Rickettsiales bacterium]
MPHFNLRYFLETVGQKRGDAVFIAQIGALDGKTFDPVHEYITRFNWNGIILEPIKEHFEKLQTTYQGNDRLTLVNTAIGEKDGTAIMHRISNEDIKNERVPKWGPGLASLYTDRNALAFDEVKEFVMTEEVKCMTLASLLAQHKVQQIDVLQIDAEGHDYHILKQLDFNTFMPMVINLEIVNLPKGEQTACKKLLDEHGYLHTKAGYDLLAVSPKFFREFV